MDDGHEATMGVDWAMLLSLPVLNKCYDSKG